MITKRFYSFSSFLAMIALSLFISCVGTVQDSDVNINSLSEEDKQLVNFSGLEKAVGISHDKVELEFTPLASTDPNIKYYLYINGSQSPIEVNPASLDDSLAGRKRYLVTGLNINRFYKFKLKIKNLLTNSESKNEKELVTQTFDNKTADFKGITSVTKVTGLSASSVFLEWVPAKMDGIVMAEDFDPAYYEVTIIGAGGAQNLNNPNYTGIDRRVIKVPDPTNTQIRLSNHSLYTSTLIDGLAASTNYFVQVRAVNKLWYGFSINSEINIIPVNRELNTKFLKIKTDPSTGLFDFNRDSLLVTNAPGQDAFSKINAFWSPGVGTFTGYRIFLKKYPTPSASEATVLGDDRIPVDENMQKVIDGVTTASDENGFYVDSPTTKTTLQIGSLTAYEWYQVKIIQCKTTLCPVFPELNPNIGIVSDPVRAIRVQPRLAPFDGITRIDHPKDASGLDEITVNFDPPTLSVGYADRLEVYCLDSAAELSTYDPVPLGSMVANARTSSNVSKCNGLYLTGPLSVTDKKVVIKGVKSIPSSSAAQATYCFAVFPAIRDQDPTEQIPALGTVPKSDWVVRCITPEVKTPTVIQYEGLKGTCNPDKDTIATSWVEPTGGLYANYRLYYRKISGGESFKFSDAIADINQTTYTSISIPKGSTSKTLTGLRPGTRYRIGILTEIQVGAKTLYSEFNTNVKDCMTPMPVATFDQWSRVFAIGPKVDGRFPHSVSGVNRFVPEGAKIFEALNVDGIPYEIGIDNSGNIVQNTYLRPPGHYYSSDYKPANFSDYFDGAPGKYLNMDVAASRNGIVSLGWRDMSLDFLGSEFKQCQRHPTDTATAITTGICPTPSVLKRERKYGYKVFRSVDNRLSWEDVTGASAGSGVSLVYARDFKYRKRSNAVITTERMAFFTDYSVQAIYSDPEGKERGRILWYKVVPYFDKKPLTVASEGVTSPNIIKVILPPPNMALVKREMANRNACMELGRDAPDDLRDEPGIDKSNSGYYSCGFNGVGSRPKGSPWNISNGIIDLGGDLLVDRFELGCQFTRGDFSSTPNTGLSYYVPSTPAINSKSNLVNFKGFITNSNGQETATNLQGCTDADGNQVNLDPSQASATAPITPNYKKYLYGDCISTGTVKMANSVCSDPTRTSSNTYKYPGAMEPNTPLLCNGTDINNPSNFADRMNVEFRRNLLLQSEFAAVFYHRDIRRYDQIYPTGPGHLNAVINQNWDAGQKQCFINLAAIGSDGKMRARWFPAEDLNRIKKGAGTQSFTKKGISQTYTDSNLYDDDEYKLPDAGLRANSRFSDATPLGKVVSANSAKLPPLTGISQDLAQEYCAAYDIEVGISTDGINFLATALPTTKRLLRKVELLAASLWPKAADNDVTSFDYTNSNITLLEGSDDAGSCINSSKYVALGVQSRDAWLTVGSATFDYEGSGSFSGKGLTGSSKQDVGSPSNQQSEKCVSEFGIQDLVGNTSELSSERIFCDYSKDKLWYGVYYGDAYNQQGPGGEETLSVQISDNQSYERLFWSDLTMYFEIPLASGGGFREVGTKVDVANAKPGSEVLPTIAWPQPDTNSGYCSIVDNTEDFGKQMNRFRDDSGNFYPVSLSGGALNTNMIQRNVDPVTAIVTTKDNKLDRESVNYLRNGDGAFLNFGTGNIAPQFKDGNSLAITNVGLTPVRGDTEFLSMALGPYFNPWIGLPMSCKANSGDRAPCIESADNTRVTTPFLAGKPGDEVAEIVDFPIGNSQITNIGISDVYHSGDGNYITVDLTSPPNIDSQTTVIDKIEVFLDGDVILHSKKLPDFWNDHPEAQNDKATFSGIKFALPRNTELIFTNGGSFNQAQTGRYSSSVIPGTEETTKYTVGPGIRCGVMINSD